MKQPTSRVFSWSQLGLLTAFASLGLLLAATGCGSLQPASASFASVMISNHSAEEIAVTTAKVFGAEGYRGGITRSGQLIFEKEASRATTMAREGFTSTYYGACSFYRVRAEMVSLSGGVYRLQCRAFVVTGGSDTFFQDEVPLSNVRSAPYQSLLNKVAKELK
jgi:hypothetical protein